MTERAAVVVWNDAMEATEDDRAWLSSAIDDLDDALDRTRPERLQLALNRP